MAINLSAIKDLLLPGLRGREKRAFFNEISGWMISGFAVGDRVAALIGSSR